MTNHIPPSVGVWGGTDAKGVRVGKCEDSAVFGEYQTAPPWTLRVLSLPIKGREV